MRFFVTVASLSALSTAVLACTVETKTTGPAASNDAGVTGSGDGGSSKPAPLPGSGTKKDAGAGTSDPPADAPKTCRAAAECLGDCAENDEKCQDACLASLPDAEMQELGDLAVCIQNSDCQDQACVEETCAAEFAACAN
jgi:hypothetical protein